MARFFFKSQPQNNGVEAAIENLLNGVDWKKVTMKQFCLAVLESFPTRDIAVLEAYVGKAVLSVGPVACIRVSVFSSACKSEQFPVAPHGGTDIVTIEVDIV
ncbi:unnamed protein product [Heligmosomoides polygyrus]|uniref:DUF4476 domain-containing protein n=1 Tax=Heligmosomoides polygyrus TaxID=6339 RepID=A0A3P8CNL6_HELPZ|nr:unnamed protein product [Heligmosomoides polygyrus]